MKSTLRRIGNSRGVLLPASLLAACEIEHDIELTLDGKRIIIEPVGEPRSGWFEGYQSENDKDAWEDFVEADDEDGDWQW
jgi:antitoxin MazE